MQHRLKYALILAALPLLASAAMAPTTAPTAPVPAVAAKLSAQIAHIAATVGTSEGHTLQTRALAAQQLPYGPSPLAARFNSNGQVQVYLHYDAQQGAPAPATLQALGATRILTSPELGVVQAWVPASALYRIAAMTQVARITIPRYAVVRRNLPLASWRGVQPAGSTSSLPPYYPQSVQALGAAQLQSATGLTGHGVSVGIISDGVGTVTGSGASATSSDITYDQGLNQLPTNPAPYIDTSVNKGGSGNEGAAMMQIAYDMAPGIALGFCGPGTTADYLQCLTNFGNGTDGFQPTIIADDLGFPGVAMFTNGNFATRVQQWAAGHPNIQLLTAAGNDAQQFWGGNWNPASVSTTISPSPSSTVNAYTYTQVQQFTGNNAVFGGSSKVVTLPYLIVPVPAGTTVTYYVQWNDFWPLSSSAANDTTGDYDVFLVNEDSAAWTGKSSNSPGYGDILACNMGMNFGPASASTAPLSPDYCDVGSNPQPFTTPSPQPQQSNSYTNNTNHNQYAGLFIYQRSGSPGSQIKVLIQNSQYSLVLYPAFTPQGSIYGQSALGAPTGGGAPYEITTAATPAVPTSAQTTAQGTAVGAGACGTTAAGGNVTPLVDIEPYSSQGPVTFSQPASGSSTIQKPDFTAVDGVNVTGAGGFGFSNNTTPQSATFCGTSATSEAVAATLALLHQAYPGQTNAQYYTMLQGGATQPTGSDTPNGTYGYGLISAYASAKAAAPSPQATITTPSSNITTVQPGGTASFSGSCSSNGAPGNTTPSWTFAGGTPASASSSAATVSYANAGQYTATLTCTNAFNQTATAQRTVAVVTPPTAEGGSISATSGQPANGTLAAKSGTASGQTLTYAIATQPAHGTVVLTNASTGTFTYTSASGYSGSDSFTFTAAYGSVASAPATENVTVTMPPPSSGGGGGGGLGLLSLAALAALGAAETLRRRRIRLHA